jgi:hypothetical protein
MANFPSWLLDPPPLALLGVALVVLAILFFTLRRAHFVALVVTTTLCLGVAEGFCRLTKIGNPAACSWQEDKAEGQPIFKPHGKLVYTYPTNPRGYFDADNQVIGTVNSHGFRGRETPIEKPEGLVRVAFLGDSFTVGIGVKDEDTLPALFEQAARADHPGVEALNFGKSATSTTYQVRLLADFAARFRPDVAVIVVFVNDTERLGTMLFFEYHFVLGKLRKVSWFANAVVGGIEKVILHRKMIEHYKEGYADGSPGWTKLATALEEAAALGKRDGFEVVVVNYPVLVRLDDSYPFRDFDDKIAARCREVGVRFLDLLPAFEGRNGQDLWVHATDQHPNEIAQKIAAEELARFMAREKLLD